MSSIKNADYFLCERLSAQLNKPHDRVINRSKVSDKHWIMSQIKKLMSPAHWRPRSEKMGTNIGKNVAKRVSQLVSTQTVLTDRWYLMLFCFIFRRFLLRRNVRERTENGGERKMRRKTWKNTNWRNCTKRISSPRLFSFHLAAVTSRRAFSLFSVLSIKSAISVKNFEKSLKNIFGRRKLLRNYANKRRNKFSMIWNEKSKKKKNQLSCLMKWNLLC